MKPDFIMNVIPGLSIFTDPRNMKYSISMRLPDAFMLVEGMLIIILK
ncbi:unnamed protein product [marine sediment metagenome]|uniref:Uncharacterized protein n=1 Tax=marine sediment metagenome TaxID=412755 RepID=X1B3D2_9ZZZZ